VSVLKEKAKESEAKETNGESTLGKLSKSENLFSQTMLLELQPIEDILTELKEIILREGYNDKIELLEELQKNLEIKINDIVTLQEKLSKSNILSNNNTNTNNSNNNSELKSFQAILIMIKSKVDQNIELYDLFLKSLFNKLNNFIIDFTEIKVFWFSKYNNPQTCSFVESFCKLKNEYIQSIVKSNNLSFEGMYI